MFNETKIGYYILIITSICCILSNLFCLLFDLMLGLKINLFICLLNETIFLIYLIVNEHKT
ncbi:hypothetical protein [Candidatus Phytoplasma mali]|uniref:hypothetical protein n=1 Tax=Apple proliferation phytoplasma TaxID=37692 RepID=UPI00059B89F7|nr:hypothetical protein [Candidatus Phytoplasma mali]